ncbi:MAG TPA: P1 family peptidase, partial [Thermomicrobiales bacterium]|nr:P1 family peptidase [Thermomicrobiales bacterium]
MTGRMRARDLGIAIGTYPTGPFNAITDVAGVEVGHATVSWGDGDLPAGQGPARTGVTAIWPGRYDAAGGEGDLLTRPVAAGFFALAGTGEMTGRSEIEELGRINTPIVLTSTMAVGTAYDATCRYLVELDARVGGEEGVVIPVVGECDDEHLNDARGFHVEREHVYRALDDASDGPVGEGCVGSGTGMTCFGFKGGIGTSSRVVTAGDERWVIGALAMTNFGRRSRLTIDGVPVGRHIPWEWGDEAERP